MNIAAIIALLTAIFKAVPTLEKWWERIVAAYLAQKTKWVETKNKDAIEEALRTGDQRGLEHESTSGQYSGVGTIRDSLPGVRDREQD